MRRNRLIGGLALAALSVSCGGGGDDNGPGGDRTTIDAAAVATGISEMGGIIPVCRPGTSIQGAPAGSVPAAPTSRFSQLVELRRDRALARALELQSLGSTKPADQFGDCGGRMTYPTYSHASGVTTGTFQFDNYCSTDSDTGEKETLNGTVSFVNTGTPSASGPITQKIEASSSAGVTAVVRTSGGATVSNQKYSFTNYLYQAGVPGGSPTSANPNRLSVQDATLSDLVSGKSYRQTNYTMTDYINTLGGEVVSVSGRSYRSNGEYFDLATTSPLTTNSSGNTVGGQLTFTGAGNSVAVLTLVPGSTLQGTMTVNGTLVTSVPVCK